MTFDVGVGVGVVAVVGSKVTFDFSRRRLLTDDCRFEVKGVRRRLFIFYPKKVLLNHSSLKSNFSVFFSNFVIYQVFVYYWLWGGVLFKDTGYWRWPQVLDSK